MNIIERSEGMDESDILSLSLGKMEKVEKERRGRREGGEKRRGGVAGTGQAKAWWSWLAEKTFFVGGEKEIFENSFKAMKASRPKDKATIELLIFYLFFVFPFLAFFLYPV